MSKCHQNFAFATDWMKLFLGSVNLITSIITILGNTIVFVLIAKSRELRTRSNVLLSSLAATDLLVGILLNPITFLMLFSYDIQENCSVNKFRRFISVILLGASIGSIAVISYDRYTHLSKLSKYQGHMTKTRIVCSLVLAWTLPLIVPMFRIITHNEKVHSTVIVIFVVICFVVTIICYSATVYVIRQKEKQLQESGFQQGREVVKDSIRAAKAITLIIVCFVLMVIPIMLYNFLVAAYGFGMSGLSWFVGSRRDNFYLVSMTLAQANSALNPVIYYIRTPGFRRRFKEMCKTRFEKINSDTRQSDVISIPQV